MGNDPLLLALTDAMVGAEEELAKAEDQLARSEGAELHLCQKERLRGFLCRFNALGFAYTAVSDEEWGYADSRRAACSAIGPPRGTMSTWRGNSEGLRIGPTVLTDAMAAAGDGMKPSMTSNMLPLEKFRTFLLLVKRR